MKQQFSFSDEIMKLLIFLLFRYCLIARSSKFKFLGCMYYENLYGGCLIQSALYWIIDEKMFALKFRTMRWEKLSLMNVGRNVCSKHVPESTALQSTSLFKISETAPSWLMLVIKISVSFFWLFSSNVYCLNDTFASNFYCIIFLKTSFFVHSPLSATNYT